MKRSTSLFCYSNKLTTLDVSKNTQLTSFRCYSNQLTTLDVSKNTKLYNLDCGINQLTTLDVSKNTQLTWFYCRINQLTTLNVSKNTQLTSLGCNNNQLTTLDVSKNTQLTRFDCSSNQLRAINLKNRNNKNLRSFDSRRNPQLTCLQVDDATAFRSKWLQKVDQPNVISNNCIKLVTNITIAGTGGATSIAAKGGKLQMVIKNILPANANYKAVTWSVDNTTLASISTSGLLTAKANGTVKVIATAKDGSGVKGTANIVISNQVHVKSISIAGTSGSTTITTKGGTLKMVIKDIQPANADNKTVKWSVDNIALASISTSGLLTAKANGTVKVIATAKDGSGVSGSASIVISNQVIRVKYISIAGTSGVTTITTKGGTLKMVVKDIQPANADNKTVKWSVDNIALASISTSGLLTAKANGTVKVIATAKDGSGVSGSASIVISNQVIRVKYISIAGTSGVTTITTKGGTLKMVVKDIQPTNADNKAVTWSVDNPTLASISTSGLLTAKANGTVKVIATAKDGSGVKGTANIVISNQDQVTSIVSSDLSDEVVLYPNPTQDRLSIETNLYIRQITITDLAGKVLKTIDGNRQSIDVSTLSPNIYFLRLSTEKGIFYRKFLKE